MPSLYSRKVTERNLKNGELARDCFFSPHMHKPGADTITVKDKTRSDILDRLVTINKLLYELLNEKDEGKKERLSRLFFFDHN